MAHTLFPARPRIWRALPEKRGQSKISGDLINPARDVTPFLFAMRRGRNDHFFTMRTAKLSRLAGGRAPKGRRGLTSTGTTPDASTDNINGSEKGRKSLTCMGPPALRAISPARRRSFAPGRTNSLSRWISNLSQHISGEHETVPHYILLFRKSLPLGKSTLTIAKYLI